MTADTKPEVVLALYKPRDGEFDALKAVLKSHVPTLQRLGMATARAPVYLRAGDGSVIEIFEWSDAAQAHRAHTPPRSRKSGSVSAAAQKS